MRQLPESSLNRRYVKGCGFVDKAGAKSSINFTHKSTSTTAATPPKKAPKPQKGSIKKIYIFVKKIARSAKRTIKNEIERK